MIPRPPRCDNDHCDHTPGGTWRHHPTCPAATDGSALLDMADQTALEDGVHRRTPAPDPYACRWCGIPANRHGRQWTPEHGSHGWEPPTNHLIKTRMRRRLAARRAQRAARSAIRYHATANWSGSYQPDDEGDMFCADCLRSDCPRFWRIQRHLDRIRWPQPRREPFPF